MTNLTLPEAVAALEQNGGTITDEVAACLDSHCTPCLIGLTRMLADHAGEWLAVRPITAASNGEARRKIGA